MMKTFVKKQFAKLTEEVIKAHAADILEQLGLSTNNDGILDRIVVSTETGENLPLAIMESVTVTQGFFRNNPSYQKGSAQIIIYPCMRYCFVSKKKGFVEMPIIGLAMLLFKKKLKREMAIDLAHELRHYWQYYTGEKYRNYKYDRMLPYEHRWEEKDANQFSYQYVSNNF